MDHPIMYEAIIFCMRPIILPEILSGEILLPLLLTQLMGHRKNSFSIDALSIISVSKLMIPLTIRFILQNWKIAIKATLQV